MSFYNNYLIKIHELNFRLKTAKFKYIQIYSPSIAVLHLSRTVRLYLSALDFLCAKTRFLGQIPFQRSYLICTVAFQTYVMSA